MSDTTAGNAEFAQPTKRRLNIKDATDLQLNSDSPLAKTAEQLAREEPDETTRRELLISMIAQQIRTNSEVQELARLLGVMGHVGPDDPLLSQFTDWDDAGSPNANERRLRVLEIAATKLPENVLWLMARPESGKSMRCDYAMDNQPQL